MNSQISKTLKKVKKLLIKVRFNHMRKMCIKTFSIATGTSETLKEKDKKRLINKKVMFN